MGGEVEVKKFSCGEFLAGGIIGFVLGCVGNGIAMAVSGALFGKYNAHNPFLGMLIGIVPGIALIFFSRRLTQRGLGQGILVASVFILLAGGLCGGGVAGLFG